MVAITPEELAEMNKPVSEDNPCPRWLYLGPIRSEEQRESRRASVFLAYGAGNMGSADWEKDGYPDWFFDDDDPIWSIEPE